MQQRSPHFLTLDQISRLMFRFSLHYFASERFRSTFQFYLVTRLVNSILSKKSAVYQFLNKVTSKRYRFDLSYPKLKLLLFSELSTRKEGGPWITRVICALYTMLSLARRTFGLPERSKRQATLFIWPMCLPFPSFPASTSINTAKRRNSFGERSLIFHFAIMDLPLVQRTHHSFRVNNPFMKNIIHDTGTPFLASSLQRK